LAGKENQVSHQNIFRLCPSSLTALLSCLAHVINLATQVLISTYSKVPYFDPQNPKGHVPTSRDEVGLVRAIAVKACIIFLCYYYCGLHADCLSGTIIFKAKRNVEDGSG
jgi:hypothetical protein